MLVSPGASHEISAAMAPPRGAERSNSVLSNLIDERAWADVRSRIETHPQEASAIINRGYDDTLALHEACKLQPPADVVKALIDAYGPAVSTTGQQSFLPLHAAMKSGSTDAVLPLLQAYPAGARKKDDTGKLPIHLGCEWGASPAVVEALITSYPEGVYVRDDIGNSPLDYVNAAKTHGDMSEVTAVLKRGPEYCAVSKAAFSRMKDEFDALMKGKIAAHNAHIAKMEKSHSEEIKLYRQLEEGYRSSLKSMGQQSSRFHKESQSLKKERASLKMQLAVLKNAEEVLRSHADALEGQQREKTAELKAANEREEVLVGNNLVQERLIKDLSGKVEALESELRDKCSEAEAKETALCEARGCIEVLTEDKAKQARQIEELNDHKEALEKELRDKCDEAEEKGMALEEARESIESLTNDNVEQAREIGELKDRTEVLKAELKDKCDEAEEKGVALEEACGREKALISDKAEQAMQIEELNGRNETLEAQLKDKCDEAEAKGVALEEALGRIELLTCDIANLKNQIEELNDQINALQLQLKEKHSEAETKGLAMQEALGRISVLTSDNDTQKSKFEELNNQAEALEVHLKGVCKEVETKEAALQDAYEQIHVKACDNAEKIKEIGDLNEGIDALETHLRDLSDVIKAKDAALLEADGRIGVLTCNLESAMQQNSEQAKQISVLNANFEKLESELCEKSDKLDETSDSLLEAWGRMEVLHRNLDSVTRHNVEQAKRIELLNETVISLSASLSAFTVPHDAVLRAMSDQSRALRLVLGHGEVVEKVMSRREKIVSETLAIEQLIYSAKPTQLEGIVWEQYVPPGGDNSVACSSGNPTSAEEIEKGFATVSNATVSASFSSLEEPVSSDQCSDKLNSAKEVVVVEDKSPSSEGDDARQVEDIIANSASSSPVEEPNDEHIDAETSDMAGETTPQAQSSVGECQLEASVVIEDDIEADLKKENAEEKIDVDEALKDEDAEPETSKINANDEPAEQTTGQEDTAADEMEEDASTSLTMTSVSSAGAEEDPQSRELDAMEDTNSGFELD